VQEFPMTINEALSPPGGLQAKEHFKQYLQGAVLPPPTAKGNSHQSSVCLFVALTVARRGMEFDAGTLAPKEAQIIYADLKAIFDGWGEPIQFSNGGGTKFQILSAGANGKVGDADDVDSNNLRLGK